MSNIFQKEKTINRVLLLPISEISPNPAQPRTSFDRETLESLAESIRQNGILQPSDSSAWKEGQQPRV